MGQRLDLQQELVAIMGANPVYYQTPGDVNLAYPCVIYELSSVNTGHANNKPYRFSKAYTLTLIDRNPDSPYVALLLAFETANLARTFTTQSLNHWIFEIRY